MAEITGISRTWEIFHQLEPEEVCSRVNATFDAQKGLYTTTSFGQKMYVDEAQRRVYSDSEEGEYLLSYTDYFFDLSVLWYLIGAQKKHLSGRLVKPSELEGGQIFVKGTHVLPLDEIAAKYNERGDAFFIRSRAFSGKKIPMGDASVEFLAFPKIPVTFILWFGDEEFPPSAQFLLDSTCTSHISTDVLWSVATVNCLFLLDSY